MAFTHDAGSSNIIDLTEEDDPVEASKAHPAHGNFATFKTIGKTETPRRSGTQETLASATSRVEAATSLLSSRLDSYKQSPKSKSNSNTSPLRKSLYADQIARTVSNVFQKPMSISDASLPRPLPFQPLESHSVPRLGGFRPPERQPSSADVRQGTSDEVWDLPESDSDEVLFDREESRLEQNVPRETPTTTPETLLVTSRAPRKAASSASRAITGSYEILNPLEASLEARVTTPRKAGRPRKDEWTPTKKPGSGRGNKQSEIVGSYNEGRSISPTPQGTTCLIPAKDESIPSAEASSVRTLSKKRKRSSVSGDDVPPPKGPGVALSPLLKSDNIADPHEKNCELLSTTQQLARMPELDFTRASWNAQTDSQSVPRGLSVSSSSLPAVVTPVEDMVSQFNSSIALTANAVLTKIFDTIVYPAIKKATKHHKGSLHDDKLVLIGKSVSCPLSQSPVRCQLEKLTRLSRLLMML